MLIIRLQLDFVFQALINKVQFNANELNETFCHDLDG